jgi:hypothetical protein
VTIHYCVFDITQPNSKPFGVIKIDTDQAENGKCAGEIISLHDNKDEAEAKSLKLAGELQ